MTTTIFPQLGTLLRIIVTRAGYRSHLIARGLDKDLDDLATDARPSTSCDLMHNIEETVQQEIARDSGAQWAALFHEAWFSTRKTIQHVVREVEAGSIADEAGREFVRLGFEVPMLCGLLRLAMHQHPGIDMAAWWASPIAAWIGLTAKSSELSEAEAIARLHDTPRTTERWMAGEPVRELQWPYRPTVVDVLHQSALEPSDTQRIDLLTGWLTLAVAFQSLTPALRDLVRRDFEVRRQHPWSPDAFIARMNQRSFDAGAQPICERSLPLLQHIEHHFALNSRDLNAVIRDLAEFQQLLDREPPHWRRHHQFIYDWFSGRLAGLQECKDAALAYYAKAVDAVWWSGGSNQFPVIKEAMLYAVGMGDLRAAAQYWDKTFMLGLNTWPKRPLDEQERRRLAFAFEQQFAPQKAHDRVGPAVEYLVRHDPSELGRQALKNPNSKVKHAEGRTRRTPLMDAIREGTLRDVKQRLAAGGDPNDFIPESGEGPLIYAMRRACDRGDTLIMDHLLRLDLLPETLNRRASTSRETPLKIAIEMADAAAVERLLVLDAKVEVACDYVPSALCYAMLLLHGSIHRADPTQEQAWLSGRTRADVHDAKDGAALDIELAARRQQLATLRDISPRHRAKFKALMDEYTRPAEPRRKVVRTLLRYGADANQPYKVEPHHVAEWTPTLIAAEVGDLGIFQAMLGHGGDPDKVLMHSSALERQDAMWVAVNHGRHAIVDFLVKRTYGMPAP